jgi:hypothetical protein
VTVAAQIAANPEGFVLSDVRSLTGRALVSLRLEQRLELGRRGTEPTEAEPAAAFRERFLHEQQFSCLRAFTDVSVRGLVLRD